MVELASPTRELEVEQFLGVMLYMDILQRPRRRNKVNSHNRASHVNFLVASAYVTVIFTLLCSL